MTKRLKLFCWLLLAIIASALMHRLLQKDEADSVKVRTSLKQRKASRNERIPWNCTDSGHMKRSSVCHRTKIFPFRSGCPAECPNQDNRPSPELFYRLYMAWYFWQPSNSSFPVMFDETASFRSPKVLKERFGQASKILAERFQSALSTTKTNLVIKKQQAMHISLSYLCCLRKDQASKTVQLMKDWVLTRDFNFRVRFDRLECWQEFPNSVTNILIVDDKSQQTLMAELRDLEDYLESHGIPIVVSRTDQMPFHSTILAVQYNKVKVVYESNNPDDDMTPLLPKIHSIVDDLDQNRDFRGLAWTKGKDLLITHKPYFSSKGTKHTQ